MTINYTTLLGLAQPVTGTEANTWGDVVNDEITALLEEAIAGGETINVTSGNVTLSDTDGTTNQARNAILLITGTPGTARNVIAPSTSKVYIVRNGSDAAVTIKGSATTGVSVPVGGTSVIFWNGSDFQTNESMTEVIVGAGAVGTPSITTAGDTNTGIYFPAADTIAFTEGGVESMRINSDGEVLINTSTTRTEFNSRLLIEGTTSTPTGSIAVINNNASAASGYIALGKTRGTIGSNTTIVSGDSLGSLLFYGADGTGLIYSARINVSSEGTIATGQIPSLMSFSTASSAGTVTERMRITSDGEVLVGGTTVLPEPYSGGGAPKLNVESAAGGYLALFRNDTSISSANPIGDISFYGNDTTANTPTRLAYVSAVASGTHGAGDNPTDLVFGTTPDGSATVTEAMRILSNGDAQINDVTVGRGGSVVATNTALGNLALRSNTTGANNTAVGYQALDANTTGTDNTAVGSLALPVNTIGIRNTALGRNALAANITGSSNTAVGRNALAASTASNNTAVGREALEANTTGTQNVAVGAAALLLNTTGIDNTAIGTSALDACTTGSENTAVGVNALTALTTGVNNTAVGSEAGNEITTGTGNTIIGYNASASAATGVDQIVLGNGVTGQANTNVTIGNGTGKIYNAYTVNATWTQTSDERLKRNIQDDTLGLSFINRLRPVKYQWKPSNEIDQSLPYYNEENNRDIATVMHGLVAQEVKAALDAEGVTTFAGWDMGEDTIQAISREMFVSPLIKAIQELSAKVTALEAQLSTTTGRT